MSGARPPHADVVAADDALAARHAAIIGAGGLGGPMAYALAHAGWRLTLVDHDTVELSNLQRQIQFRTADIGRPKVEALADELARRGCAPGRIRALPVRFEPATAAAVLAGVDIVLDGSDDFATKFAVNDHAVAAGLPFVIASVVQYRGQVFAHDARPWPRPWPRGRGLRALDAPGCYRCIFEEPPGADEAGPTCADAGVLGAAVAVIGGIAARAALGVIRGSRGQDMLAGEGLWVFDDVRTLERVRHVPFVSRPSCLACGIRAEAPPPPVSLPRNL
jgi:molybdopterin/thiamine biosynthesis adenylyltransferase